MATIAWNEWWFKLYVFQLYSIPFITIDIDVLPPISWKGMSKSAQDKAVESQLQIANHLGMLATCRTNRDYFELYEKSKKEGAKGKKKSE
jgi:hypothetical protein